MSKIERRFIDHEFPIGAVAIGYAIILLAIVVMILFRTYVFPLILIVLGVYLALSHVGILLDFENRKFKYYKSKFGIKEGNWKFFKYYPYLSLLTINQKQTTYSFTNAQNTSRFIVYRVCLLNEKHTEKIVLKEHRNKKVAENYLDKLTEELSLEKTIYSPDFS